MPEPSAAPWSGVGAELAAALAAVDPGQFAAAVDFLSERPGRWFFTGQGRSGLVARMVAMRFMHLGRAAYVVGETTTPAVGAGDHLIALSRSGRTAVTGHFAERATTEGADLLVVTGDPTSPLAALAGATLRIPAEPSAQFGGSLFEQAALILLDTVAAQLVAELPGGHAAMAGRHANLE